MDALKQALESEIGKATGKPFRMAGSQSLGGGCIHNASRISGEDGRTFFIKQNDRSHLAPFKAEAEALQTMHDTGTVRVPAPVCVFGADGQAVLVLEFLAMGGRGQRDWAELGRQLALMHRHTGAQYGWPHDNWIGSTPQINTRNENWIDFYAECRLQPQFDWAKKRGLRLREADHLIEALPHFFIDHTPVPSLLHGDLWGGNADFLEDGTPVIFDPAAYYGDRETDLAMTEMFGGFGIDFYKAYEKEWPLDPGYRVRKDLYILYHVLNHYTIFGGGYGSQAESLTRRLLRDL